MDRTGVALALWLGLAVLALLGLAGAGLRAVGVVESLRRDAGRPIPELSRFDPAATLVLSKIIGAQPGTETYAELDRQVHRFYRKFNQHPLTTLGHVVPAALFMLFAPVQFVVQVRRRKPWLHRWTGRLVVLLSLPIGLSGLYFGLAMPFAGSVEAAAILVFGVWFLYAVARGFLAIRNRDFHRHREWMLRAFAVALGVSMVRLVGLPLAAITQAPPAAWFGYSAWLGFGLAAGFAEIWMRWSRNDPTATIAAV